MATMFSRRCLLSGRTLLARPPSFPPTPTSWATRGFHSPSIAPERRKSLRELRFLSTQPAPPSGEPSKKVERRENIYTIPNALTVGRMFACPVIGYYVLEGRWGVACSLLAIAGITDVVDGYLARTWNQQTVVGSIIDPAADKLLMTTMVVTLAIQNMIPLPLAVIILGRDVGLSISAFYFRYASLPEPKTFTRYWDFSIPSASVHPTQISKVNTLLQLLLVGATTVSPLVPWEVAVPLTALQYTVGATTIWSGLSYITGSKDAVKYIK